MVTFMRALPGSSVVLFIAAVLLPAADPPRANPFYAMDTCTKRPYPTNDITPADQLDILRQIGYAGIAWTEEPADRVASVIREAENRGLKMFTIYCSATVTKDGSVSFSPHVEPLFATLEGHGTLLWLHISGPGPSIATLTADSPPIRALRNLAEKAGRHGLDLAIYPHVRDWTERINDAVQVARLVDRKNLGVTFNLCHALAMGDEERIPSLLEQAAPYLKAVTINGADSGVEGPAWARLIQPLDRGSYDASILLSSLRRLGYAGPIGLQGYGLRGDRRENLERSMGAWRKIMTSEPGANRR